jgi:hypothetical protein
MMLRYSEVDKPMRLHDQLNRNVQISNDVEAVTTARLTTHADQISTLQTQLTAALARITALENANQTN